MQEITIIKCNHHSEETWRYTGKLLKQGPSGVVIEAKFNRPDLPFHGILLKENDRFIEAYPFEKWFNVYEIHDRDTNMLKAWYCNVTRPVRISNHEISYDDLALDLLVYPDGQKLSLDFDDFRNLDLEDKDQENALKGLEELQQIFTNNPQFDIFTLIS